MAIGVIKPVPLSVNSDSLLYALDDKFSIKGASRLNLADGTPSRAIMIKFSDVILPKSVNFLGREYPVSSFNTPILRCTKCQSLSHSRKSCTSETICSWCSGKHSVSDCHSSMPKCVNCSGGHSAAWMGCPKSSGAKRVNHHVSAVIAPGSPPVEQYCLASCASAPTIHDRQKSRGQGGSRGFSVVTETVLRSESVTRALQTSPPKVKHHGVNTD